MFPELPADLSVLSHEDLLALINEFGAGFEQARASVTSTDDIAALQAAAEAIERLGAERTQREENAAALIQQAEEIAARVAPIITPAPEAQPAEGENQPAPAGDQPAAPAAEAQPATPEAAPAPAPELEPVAAAAAPAATPAAPPRVDLAQLAARVIPAQAAAPRDLSDNLHAIVASGLPGMRAGMELRTRDDVTNAFIDAERRLGNVTGLAVEARWPVVAFTRDFPADRRFDDRMSQADVDARITEVRQAGLDRAASIETLTAAGGLCAPTEGYYDQQVLAETGRPARDAIVNFGAARGGIRFTAPPKMSDITAGVGVVSAAQDLAGGVGAVKGTFDVTCAATVEKTVSAVYAQLQFGNFGQRSYAENYAAWWQLALALHDRTAETLVLDGIAASPTIAVTAAGLVGAAREVLARLGQAAMGYRNRNRMRSDAPLELLAPAWLLDLMQADIARSFTDENDQLGITLAQIEAFLRTRALIPNWYRDSKTGGSQVIGAQSTGVLNEFPTTALVYVYAPGTFLHLDAGTLELGLVRDTATLAVNKFKMFVESFEGVANVGVESLEVSLALAPDGSYGASRTMTVPIVT